METHDLGRAYWHFDKRYKSWKPTQISRAQMTSAPYRRGLGLFISLPGLRKGLVMGWWGRKNRFDANDLDPLPEHLMPGTRVLGDRTEEVRSW